MRTLNRLDTSQELSLLTLPSVSNSSFQTGYRSGSTIWKFALEMQFTAALCNDSVLLERNGGQYTKGARHGDKKWLELWHWSISYSTHCQAHHRACFPSFYLFILLLFDLKANCSFGIYADNVWGFITYSPFSSIAEVFILFTCWVKGVLNNSR